ncbi:ARM repeat-containing protein [Auricularia subglabra TFB-10046 SS5]|nr:ARM repeat-containing protein [Auricularia subglabra TFB-10046 SS5]
MDATITRGLCDKMYDKRKASALDLEKVIRECMQQGDTGKINQIIEQLVEIFNAPGNALHIRNGGLIGLAATAIALGVDVAQYADKFLEPLLSCFSDAETRIRYFACESMYNICKVSKGEILVYFNPIFDALSRLAADNEASVKNGAELLDRLLKDIVAESAAVYVPQFQVTEKARRQYEDAFSRGVVVPAGDEVDKSGPVQPPNGAPKKAFSLARFIPLLSERIKVINPFTRSFLVSWISLLDSVPDLELTSFLPDILDGLLSYLSDPSADVRTATENLLAEFLGEMRKAALVQRSQDQKSRARKAADLAESTRRADSDNEKLPDITSLAPERGAFLPESEERGKGGSETVSPVRDESEEDYRDTGAWVPGQGVRVDYGAIVEILIRQLEAPRDPNQPNIEQQHMALEWITALLEFAEDVMTPFTPRLIPVILSSIAHEIKPIQEAAVTANQHLFAVIQKLPSLPVTSTLPPPGSAASSVRNINVVPSSPPLPPIASQPLVARDRDRGKMRTPEPGQDAPSPPSAERIAAEIRDRDRERASSIPVPKSRTNTVQSAVSGETLDGSAYSRPESPVSSLNLPQGAAQRTASPDQGDPFDYQATVSALTVQFLSDHEETKVAALRWLMMLQQKAPKKILAMDDGTFPLLLKILSDDKEKVVRHDLQLLAQISLSSEEGYFKFFMANLLELFSTDRQLLESRGSMIIRQLCTSLGAERIYRTFSEILEREEDLEFASVIVQRLNLILITAPELADCRKRLKSAEGQAFFIALYRSWCHNPVAVFALCLLAQAYEHASNLLLIFADLEITVGLLVQIDKLVQLIESPVFTYLRLQLLEPEKHPFLFKCLYGLLMTLPQSTAFVSLRNRLNAVSSMGFLHIAPRAATMPPPTVAASARSKIIKEDIKWQDLLNHFRAVQVKHEKSRRMDFNSSSGNGPSLGDSAFTGTTERTERSYMSNGSRPTSRRRVTGESVQMPLPPPIDTGGRARPPALSPLNPIAQSVGQAGPRARGPPALPETHGRLASIASASSAAAGRPMSPTLVQMKQKQGPIRR